MADRRRGGGFTLIELLVVIAIIAVLVAVMLPALAKSRYLARKIASMSNMRQTSLLIFAYAQDNQARVPNSVRQDQGCNYWNNFYIIVYPTNLVTNTIGYTIRPYVTRNTIFMAPNQWDHLSVFRGNSPGSFNYWYGYWYDQPVSAVPFYRLTSYSYMPWLGFLAYPGGPTMKVGDNVAGARVPFNNLVMLGEVVAVESRDADPADGSKSVNFVNGVAEGGNLLFGDGSAKWAPKAAYTGGLTSLYVNGGYTYTNYDVLYRR